MAEVRGIGGIFFKTENPAELYAWYAKHLGIKAQPGQGAIFQWRTPDDPSEDGMTVWSIFPNTSEYFRDDKARFMINYIVDDLDGLLQTMRAAGVTVDERVERSDYGNFGWLTDPAGNRIELWEPKPEKTKAPETTGVD